MPALRPPSEKPSVYDLTTGEQKELLAVLRSLDPVRRMLMVRRCFRKLEGWAQAVCKVYTTTAGSAEECFWDLVVMESQFRLPWQSILEEMLAEVRRIPRKGRS